MAGAYLASAKSKVHRISSNIDGLRERFDGDKTNNRYAVYRSKAVVVRERSDIERLWNSI